MQQQYKGETANVGKHSKNRTRAKRNSSTEVITKHDPTKLDQLGIERGQNAEKGNTIRPENLRDAKEAAH